MDLTKRGWGEYKILLECNTNGQEPTLSEGMGGDHFIVFLEN
jgi:hypothetical protein